VWPRRASCQRTTFHAVAPVVWRFLSCSGVVTSFLRELRLHREPSRRLEALNRAGSNNVLVVRLGFVSPSGGRVYMPCDDDCVLVRRRSRP
jgi:hypothetical protein